MNEPETPERMPYYTDYEQDGWPLIGPNGFSCVLGEPEDRTWGRDGSDVVDELNRLLAALVALKDTARAVINNPPCFEHADNCCAEWCDKCQRGLIGIRAIDALAAALKKEGG